MEIQLGNYTIQGSADKAKRLSMLLWGPAGCGKTTLAATAPGKKLWINFDPDGTSSIANRDDVLVLDLSNEKHSVTRKFKDDDGLGLGKILADSANDISTVVVDSLTSYSQLATEAGISETKGATLERPSPGAYGARNALTLRLIAGILRLTATHNKHVILITHEDSPKTDDDGNVLFITMLLGGKIPDQAALQMSEVWFMNDTGKERRIAVRPVRTRKPMKSRMFSTPVGTSPEFLWKYDADLPFDDPKNTPHTLATWYQQWIDANGKLSLPK